MASRVGCWTIIVAFAIAEGHLAWNSLVGPPMQPDYFIGGQVSALSGPTTEDKNLYLRRMLYLPQRPRRAWLQAIGRDRLQIYVNGKFLEEQFLDGFPVAIVADLAPFLKIGPNVIAVVGEQASIGIPPVIAVEGAYELEDGVHPLRPDEGWRCRTVFERRAHWWFETKFDDRHWEYANVTPCFLRAKVMVPPRAVTATSVAHWISPPSLDEESAGVRREFQITTRPRQAWLRLTATSPYRLAVNGIVLDEQEDQVGTTQPVPPVQRLYDISPVMRRGTNVLALVLTRTGSSPHLLADLEIEDGSGHLYQLGTDDQWISCPGTPLDWFQLTLDNSSVWHPCYVEFGDLGVPPWEPRRQEMEISLPYPVVFQHLVGHVGLIVLIALLTLIACRITSGRLAILEGGSGRFTSARIVYLALVPPTLAIAGAVLATYDPRIPKQDVYRGLWVLCSLISVPLQWGLLAIVASRWNPGHHSNYPSRGYAHPSWVTWSLLILLLGVGFWLRFRNMETEPMQWDEVDNYRATQGFLKRGFPCIEVHKDLPPEYVHTSELVYVPKALIALFSDNDIYVVRFPGVCWSTLTIWLICLIGRRLFSTPVGLIAATIYTLSPVCIAMSNFGRYFSQLQFFALLTIYFYWLTIRGKGPIDHKALWITAISFIATFLSWEGGALIAPGMMIAALLHRRGHLRTILGDFSVWGALGLVLMVVALQYSHKVLQVTQFLWYGISTSDVSLKPMWLFPDFQPWYYVWESSWNQDGFIPMLGLLSAGVLATRHSFRRTILFLLLIHLTTCLITAALLSVTAWRYIHHLTPVLILLASVAVVAAGRGLVKLARQPRIPIWWRRYAQGVSLLLAIIVISLGSGMTVQLAGMPKFRVEAYGITVFKFPNLMGPARFLENHFREGDVVLATDPPQVNHLMRRLGRQDWSTDYWLASTLSLPATLDDHRSLPLDRGSGTVLVPNLESLQNIFSSRNRIWYVMQPERHTGRNVDDVSNFLRQNMEVVFEDFDALVLLRDTNHWPASLRQKSDTVLSGTRPSFLPAGTIEH